MNDEHAPPDSILGQLQRGRGLGFLRVLEAPRSEAQRMLSHCILNDPRIDSQCEDRADYYAILALVLELPLNLLAVHLRTHGGGDVDEDRKARLTIQTLRALAKRSCKPAAEILLEHVEQAEDWSSNVADLVASGDRDVQLRLAGIIECRFPTVESLHHALDWEFFENDEWRTLSRLSPRIGKVMELPNSRTPSRDAAAVTRRETEGMNARQLLELARDRKRMGLRHSMENAVRPGDMEFLKSQVVMNDREVAATALWGIARLATPDLFDWLRDTYTAHPDMWSPIRVACIRAMTALPPETTLPLGRLWLNRDDWHLRRMAEDLLAAHASAEDLPLLSETLREALAGEPETSYRICNLAKAIGNLSGIGRVPELQLAFETVRHSCARWSIAPALRTTDPDGFRDNFSFECLWDCESAVRREGISSISTNTLKVRDRLWELTSDPYEDEDVRDAARERIPNR